MKTIQNNYSDGSPRLMILIRICWGLCIFLFLGSGSVIALSIDTESLASKIAQSIQQIPGTQYRTIAISRIKKQNASTALNIDELIDYTNVKVVRAHRFQVTDRSKLQLILKEQRIQLSEFVSPSEYKELGKILGVQLFIYGTLYNETLVLKAIDIQTSTVAWSAVFALQPEQLQHQLLNDLGEKLMRSLTADLENLKKADIKHLSFWNIEVSGFVPEQVIDYLTTALSKEPYFQIIDRENLQLLYQEQRLNQSDFIDESQAKRLGELYGVDAFLYGSITNKPDGSYIASLKLISIYTGVILWADLIKFSTTTNENDSPLMNPFDRKRQERLKSQQPSQTMVTIPSGAFTMGNNDPLYQSSPERIVTLPIFLIDIYEVTQEEYGGFVQRTRHRVPTGWSNGVPPPDKKAHPITGIGWEDANLYCQSVGKRLPTEAEWERAARGPNGRHYSWKEPYFSPSLAVTNESGASQSVPSQTYGQDLTPEGVMHLIGNVREFVADVYRPYSSASKAQKTGSDRSSAEERVIRGSSWAYGSYEAAAFYRGHSRSNLAWPDVGFRCAKDARP